LLGLLLFSKFSSSDPSPVANLSHDVFRSQLKLIYSRRFFSVSRSRAAITEKSLLGVIKSSATVIGLHRHIYKSEGGGRFQVNIFKSVQNLA